MKIILAHSGRQHSYKTATALKNNGILFKYATTVYRKKYSLTNFVTKFLIGDSKTRAVDRTCESLENDDVLQICEFAGLMLLFIAKFKSKKGKKIYGFWEEHINKRFGIKLAKYAIKNKVDAVITYDTQAKYLGRYLKNKKPEIKLIMDVSAANLHYVKKIFEKDAEVCPDVRFRERSAKEMWVLWNDKYMANQKEQLKYIDHFIVASDFVKESLEYNNIKSDNISICPYGAYFDDTVVKERSLIENRPVNVIFVGKLTVLKGIYYMLEAMMKIPKETASFTVVGGYENDDEAFTKYLDRVNFVGAVVHDKVVEYLENSDVFIIASFCEGFSLSALEAMNMGLPVIITENCGIKDFVNDYHNGFVIPVQNTDAIVEKINWFYNNKEKIKEMGDNAAATAKHLSWENYYSNLYNVVKNIMEK